MSTGDPIPAGTKPLEEAITEYLADCVARGVSSKPETRIR
jgi:hypothetical protein